VSLTRRVLLLGAAGLGAGVTAAAVVEGPRAWHRAGALIDPPAEPHVTGAFASAARRGRRVRWAIAYPPGATADIPVTLVLHGRGDNYATAFGSHALDRFLAAAVVGGTPPFALASVDGGDHTYWHRRRDGDDPQRMLTDELVPMLARRGLRTAKLGLSGWSMGGYGALLLAERLGSARCAAVAVDSPALWRRASETAPGAFDDGRDFVANDVFAGRARLTGMDVRVAIGRSDPFYAATREFVAGVRPTPQTDFGVGGHTAAFWRHSAAGQLRFLGRALAGV
jgi:enterochelin esterase-like enzyme